MSACGAPFNVASRPVADISPSHQTARMPIRRRSVLGSLAALSLWNGNAQADEQSPDLVSPKRDARRPAPSATSISIPTLPEGWNILTYSVLAGGTLAIVGSDEDLHHEWRRDSEGRVLGKPSEVAARALGRIWTFDGTGLVAGPIFPLLTPFPRIDRFPDGRWLVASVRKWPDLPDRILDEAGSEISRLTLGDGIMQMKIDASDRIWVGWFDEGVFGNETWRVPDLEWPPSAYGLAAFDSAGKVLRVSSGSVPEEQIADCYALNVIGDQVWASTFPGSPISMSNDGAAFRWWRTTLDGSLALAVAAPYFLAAGGFGDEGDRVVLGRLDQDHVTIIDEWRLPFSVGFPSAVELVDAREDRLHVVVDGFWHVWSMDQFQSEKPE